ncbi:MAG: phosphate ABC transporter permease PstA [Lachnospiraceae bacterium]|nr:phosphate ABC transporter permease PstA [Lachnospiraceae bacterium]
MEMVQSLNGINANIKEEQGINKQTWRQKMKAYKKQPLSLFLLTLVTTSAIATIGILLFLIGYILLNGVRNLSFDLFAWEYTTENVSMLPALLNTLYMTGLTLLLAVPVGVFSAIYLVEYAKRGNKLVNIVRITTETLQGIPSIVYGLFGYLMFCIGLNWGYTLLAGAITLAIMVLPVIMRTTEEALLAVPDSYREGSFGLGAGRLRTVFRIVLPSAMPGIIAGVILAIGRIVGETAALIFTAGTVATAATGLFDSTRTLAVHMYCLLNEGLYMEQAYATAVVLLFMVLGINALSSYVAKRFIK